MNYEYRERVFCRLPEIFLLRVLSVIVVTESADAIENHNPVSALNLFTVFYFYLPSGIHFSS